jgi:hypothetical protein
MLLGKGVNAMMARVYAEVAKQSAVQPTLVNAISCSIAYIGARVAKAVTCACY